MTPTVGHRAMLFTLLAVALLYGFATTLRYASPWAEGDTAFFARAIAAVVDHGSLDGPDNPHPYPQGFAFQSWAASLVLLTGVSVENFVRVLSPVLGSLFLTITGFATFRRLLGSPRAAFLATLTLFLIPEVMFSVLRGNHEKVTLAVTLLACLGFVSSLPNVARRARTGSWRLVYALAVLTAVSANVYFGSILVVALTVVLPVVLVAQIFPAWRAWLRPLLPNLAFAVVSGWALVAMVMLVIYPPAGGLLRVLPNLLTGLGSLAESTAAGSFTPASNPYAVVRDDWVSARAYQVLSLLRWILFGSSFFIWLFLCAQLLRRRAPRSAPRTIALALYGAFGLILALSIPIDLIGLDLGSNLQVRVYVYFALFSAPIFALGVSAGFARIPAGFARAEAASAVALLFAFFMGVGFLKAVNDPLVSNVWRFYAPTEVAAVDFFVHRQPNRQRALWIGPDNRLRDAFGVSYPSHAVRLMRFDASGIANPAAINVASGARPDAEFALDSSLLRQHAAILAGVRVPPSTLGSRVYDNGDAAITYLGAEAWAAR